MGSIHLPPLSNLALALAKAGGLREFVETGTHIGLSLPWAADHFDRVWTIEINSGYQDSAKDRLGARDNVTFVLGDSAERLPEICAALRGPALFWLDAHTGGGNFGSGDHCPLMAELTSVLASGPEHCIFIDDARAFVAPPPPPFDYLQWPTLEEVMAAILRRPNYHAVVISDAMIVVPAHFRKMVAEYVFRVRPKI